MPPKLSGGTAYASAARSRGALSRWLLLRSFPPSPFAVWPTAVPPAGGLRAPLPARRLSTPVSFARALTVGVQSASLSSQSKRCHLGGGTRSCDLGPAGPEAGFPSFPVPSRLCRAKTASWLASRGARRCHSAPPHSLPSGCGCGREKRLVLMATGRVPLPRTLPGSSPGSGLNAVPIFADMTEDGQLPVFLGALESLGGAGQALGPGGCRLIAGVLQATVKNCQLSL